MDVPFDPDDVERQDEVARRLLATAARIRAEQERDEGVEGAQTQQLLEPVD
jgi:hypothetical protein